MNFPPLRVVPPSPGQLAGHPDAAYAVFIARGAGDARLRAALQRLDDAGEGPIVVSEESGATRLAAPREVIERLAAYLAAVGHEAAGHLRRYLHPAPAWQLRTRALPLDRPHIMGILNLTEDSFSGDGVGDGVDAAVRRAAELRDAGAALIDVGAESARADRPVRAADGEAAIVSAVVAALVREGHIVSADSYKPIVAAAALDAGAEVVNDISGLTLGTGAAEVAARASAGYVLNYSHTVPKQRPEMPPAYDDVVIETLAWFFARLDRLREAGLGDVHVAVDPGIAFGKSHDEDLQVLRRLGELTTPGRPLLLAHSRKNFIGSITGERPAERDLETHLVSATAYLQGARIFRVHDVAGTRRGLEMAMALAATAGTFAPGPGSWPWRAGASSPHMTTGGAEIPAPPGQRW